MHAIRHHLLALAGLIVLAFILGPAASGWVALALVVCVGVNRSAALFHFTRHAGPIIATLTFGSLVLAVAASIVLFLTLGWPAAVSFVVLLLVYMITAENSYDRSRRRARALRDALCILVRSRTAGQITDEQLVARADRLLGMRLSGRDFQLLPGPATLTSDEGLSTDEHRRLLGILDQYLSRVEQRGYPSPLHLAVRERLGSV